MTITRNFKLYLNAGTASAPYINVNQYDEGEEWVFTLYNEDGSTYTPSSGAIIGIKSDGNAIMNAGSVVGGKVVITETEQMTAASGRAIFELLIDNATHGTANFIVNVERRPSDDAEFSDSDLSMLQEAINSAAEIEDLLGGQDIPTVITPIITDWLDDNITNPSNPPIDTSLTVAGAAADAKKTGDEITDLKSALGNTPIILEAKLNELVPCYLGGGKMFTIQTADGSNFVVNNLMLYDENKVFTSGNFYALKAQNTNSRTLTIPANKTFYYVALDGGTAQKCKIINMPQNIGGQVASVTNEIVNINHAVSENLSTSSKIAILHATGELVPIGIKTGDYFVVKTLYGNRFAGGDIRLYDSNQNYVGYYGLSSNQGAFRSLVATLDIGYVSITVAQDIAVINTTDISQEVNNSINTDVFKSSADIDRKSVQKNSVFDFIFFSDIHNSETNGNRIFDYAEKIGADCIINGGDTVGTVISDDISWYNTLMSNSTIDTLTCIGNHDAWTSQNPQVDADQTDIYAKFITPMLNNVSNIIQPADAATNGYCYYYKDYDDIRIIVLQAMPNLGWTTAQNTWFASVLADAITNNKAVICVNHAPYYAEYADIDTDCPLNSFYGFSGFDAIKMPQDAVASVDTFINNGGEFVCWLTGHTHGDYVMHNTVYPNQFLINIATARFSRHFDGYAPTETETWSDNYDCFDYIGIDTTNKMLKVLRIGYNEDASMRIRKRWSYDFSNNKLLAHS